MQKTTTTTRQPQPPTKIPTKRDAHDTEMIDEMDALLDEIDHVLEDNALEVTRRYRQRNGE